MENNKRQRTEEGGVKSLEQEREKLETDIDDWFKRLHKYVEKKNMEIYEKYKRAHNEAYKEHKASCIKEDEDFPDFTDFEHDRFYASDFESFEAFRQCDEALEVLCRSDELVRDLIVDHLHDIMEEHDIERYEDFLCG
jgi:hypothetical protein